MKLTSSFFCSQIGTSKQQIHIVLSSLLLPSQVIVLQINFNSYISAWKNSGIPFCNMRNFVAVIEIKVLNSIGVVGVSNNNIHCTGSLSNDLCLKVTLKALAKNSSTTGNSLPPLCFFAPNPLHWLRSSRVKSICNRAIHSATVRAPGRALFFQHLLKSLSGFQSCHGPPFQQLQPANILPSTLVFCSHL